jgi:hypothetical protein
MKLREVIGQRDKLARTIASPTEILRGLCCSGPFGISDLMLGLRFLQASLLLPLHRHGPHTPLALPQHM